MTNILVPVGTSSDAHETLQYAVDFASDFGARIYVMEVFSAVSKAGTLANVTEKIAERGKERLKGIIAKIEKKNVEIKVVTYNGELVDGLNDVNKEMGIDLIILAPRSHDIQEELYLGATSGGIIKRTDIPTLVVPKGT
jgi:nucleotide-binding universal stress UspA family protein